MPDDLNCCSCCKVITEKDPPGHYTAKPSIAATHLTLILHHQPHHNLPIDTSNRLPKLHPRLLPLILHNVASYVTTFSVLLQMLVKQVTYRSRIFHSLSSSSLQTYCWLEIDGGDSICVQDGEVFWWGGCGWVEVWGVDVWAGGVQSM